MERTLANKDDNLAYAEACMSKGMYREAIEELGQQSTISTRGVFLLARSYEKMEDFDRATTHYKIASKRRCIHSLYALASILELGKGCSRDPPLSLKLYNAAAMGGNIHAMYRLGRAFTGGSLNLKVDVEKAINWYKRSGMHAPSLYQLSKIYDSKEERLNYMVNESLSLSYLLDATYLNYPPALFQLGTLYELGRLGVKLDTSRAVTCFQRSAELGYYPASQLLGNIYEKGFLDVSLSLAESIYYYKIAIQQGSKSCFVPLAEIYIKGENGIPHDPTQAFYFISQALGKSPAANFIMADMLEHGIGCSIDLTEPADGGGILFGSWYDRLHQDTAVATNQRLAYKPLSLFQSDVNITDVLQADYVDEIFSQIRDTNSDAIIYLTVYPIMGFDVVSDVAISDLATKVKNLVQVGGRIMIRYASEMNGAWFTYGQKPTAFIKSWIKVVSTVRAAAGADKVAFIWAPNSGNGYPYPNDTYSQTPKNTTWDATLDTNGDGLYDEFDDPYTPFYPGDQYVDWVGLSAYHYGKQWPWVTNDVPLPNQVENTLIGAGGFGYFNFYQMFSGNGQGGQPAPKSRGSKPFIITETAATIHLAVLQKNGTITLPLNSDAQSRVAIKQGWYKQMLNANFLASYPKVKAICFFEFIKFEESTWRDFSVFGGDNNLNSPLGNDGAAKDSLVLQAFQADLAAGMDKLIIWGNVTANKQIVTGSSVPISTSSSVLSAGLDLLILALTSLHLL